MNQKYSCPGCQKPVMSMNVKTHIKNCSKYDSFYLRTMKKLGVQDDINKIKFLSEQLTLAKDYLESVLQKMNPSEDDLSSNKKNGSNPIVYKSDFLSNQKQPEIRVIKKDPFFDNDQSHEKEKVQKPKIIIKQQPKMRMQEERMVIKQKCGMRMQEGRMYGMKQFEVQDLMMPEQDLVNPYGQEIVQCPLCKKKFYANYDTDKLQFIHQCWHQVCKVCLKKYVEDEFLGTYGFPPCPKKQCTNTIPQHQSKDILGPKFQILQNKIMSGMTNLVECTKCRSQYDFAPGNPNDAPKKDEGGKALDSQYAILYAEQRFVCPKVSCKTQQCKQCHATPYHLGMTCKQFKKRALMKKCRYCLLPITEKNINKNSLPALSDICNNAQCQATAKNACTKILPCSHPCSGVKNQLKCLPCLKENCCEKQPSLKGQKGSEYCLICYSEGLENAPSIQCGCGHIFHFHCLKKKIEVKWLTPRILFSFCLCPLCKVWIEVPPENQLYETLKEMKQLHNKIEKMALDRLKFQECDKDQRLTNKESPYYNKPKDYAMAIYAYFMCYKCKKPYFGGRKNCADVMNAGDPQKYDPKELVCPGCCDIPIDNCPKHGNDFIEFKCKFCCSIAQWFCWGNTHFCEPCHKKQCNGDYVSKYTKDQLPKCPGPGKCPIGGNHGENGDQKMLGCAICRNFKQNHKNF